MKIIGDRFLKSITISTVLLLFFISSPIFAGETSQAEARFQIVDQSVVLDTQTGLMWASSDNGADIDFYEAETYCKRFAGSGYDDWRMPDIKELATLYSGDKKNRDGYSITKLIKMTDCCMWSSDISMAGSSTFSFRSGKKPFNYMLDSYQLRILPVRGERKDVPKKK